MYSLCVEKFLSDHLARKLIVILFAHFLTQGKLNRIRNIHQTRTREHRVRLGRVQRFFTAVLSVITTGCITKQSRSKIPFSFENPGANVSFFCWFFNYYFFLLLSEELNNYKVK